MCPEGTSAQGPRGDGGFPLRGRAFSRRDGRVWVDRALGPQSQSVPGPPWSPVALNTSGSSAPTSPPCLITGCGARLCRDGVGGRGLTCSGRAGCCPVPLRLGLVCVGFGGGAGGPVAAPRVVWGAASAHVCQASSLDPSLQEWLVDRARSGSSGSSQANAGHSPEAEPHSGVQAGPLQDRHLSDCAPGRGVEGLRLSPGLLDGGQGLPEARC